MAKETLRLVETYQSVQGEGPRTGLPTVFVRFAGCNMRCPGWPCDTQHAIDPKLYMAEEGSFSRTPEQLVSHLLSTYGPMHLCLTGGEPFLQRGVLLQEFCELAYSSGFTMECFTNGSFDFPQWAFNCMTFMMDWKLSGSGEAQTAIDIRLANVRKLRRYDGIKFVVVNQKDMEEARHMTRIFKGFDIETQLWVAPAWGRIEPETVVNFILDQKMPWRLNLQTHKYIWDPNEVGV